MADTTKNILLRVKSDTDDAEKGFKSLKQELREIEKELNRMAMAGEDGTEAFQKMSLRAGELKDQISDTKARINALASDTFKLDAMTGAVEGLASGFTIVEGATALFGAENDDLQKTLVKVQGAMALLQGAQSIQNLLQKESAVYIAATTTAQKLYNAVVGESTGALKVFKTALLTTGIGAIIVGIGTLVAHWDDLKKVIGLTNDKLETTKKAIESVGESFGKERAEVQQLTYEFNLHNTSAKRKKEIIEELQKISPNYFGSLDKEKTKVEDLTKAQNKFNTALSKQGLLKGYQKQLEDLNNEQAKLNVQLETGTAETSLWTTNLVAIENLFTKDIFNPEAIAKKIQAAGSKEARERIKEIEKQIVVVNGLIKKTETEIDNMGGKAVEETTKTTENRVKNTKKVVKEVARANVEMITLATKDVGTIGMEIVERFADTSDLLRNYQRASLEKMLNDNRNSLKDMQTAVDEAYKNRLISQEQYIAENLRLHALEVQGQRDTAKAVADVLGAMSDLVGKQTKAGKVMATASALINTYLGISEVLKAKNPYPEPFGTAIKIANASVIGINGFKQVREINKVQIPNQPGGGSTGSQPSLSGATGSTPSMGAIGSQLSGATKIQLNQFENFKNPVVRAYVVESEVTGTQQRAKRLKQTSMIK